MNDLASFIEKLEVIAFFAGYPILYLLLQILAEMKFAKSFSFSKRIVALLPFAYALSGTLFLGLMFKNMYPHYSAKDFAEQFQGKFLRSWAILSLVFWIPAFSKKTVLSFLHSLVFFSILLKDIFLQINSSVDSNVIKNDMNIYTVSIILNILTLVIISTLSFTSSFLFISRKKKNNR